MTFSSSKESWSNLVTLPVSRVREILAANRNGEKVDSLHGSDFEPQVEEPTYRTEEDSITRFDKAKKRKKKRNKQRNEGDNAQPTQSATPQSGEQQDVKPQCSGKHHKGKHHHHNNHKKQE